MSKIADYSKLAAGAVGTGFRYPTVALYGSNGAPGTHTKGRRLARIKEDSAFFRFEIQTQAMFCTQVIPAGRIFHQGHDFHGIPSFFSILTWQGKKSNFFLTLT